jgi:hypothetical protein
VHGPSNTTAFDIDHNEYTRLAFAALGVDLTELLSAYPTPRIRGNPEKLAKPIYKLPAGVTLTPKKLSWPHPDGPDPKTGGKRLVTVFELRAGQVQDLLPPSWHPLGIPYGWHIDPEECPIAEMPPEILELWQHWDEYEHDLLSACPWHKPEPKRSPKPREHKEPSNSVIQAFNQAHDVRELLKKHGYEPKGTDRFIAPGSTSGLAGVKIFDDGRVYSHHGSDPLADTHSHDAFSVFCILAHKGDTRAAVREAAKCLRMDRPQKDAPEPPPRMDDDPHDQEQGKEKTEEGTKAKGSEYTEEPIPLIPEQDPPLPYPLDALGEALGNAAQAIAEYVQFPEAMAGQSVLAAGALALQPFYAVDVPSLGRPRPLSLNALTIAESGDRKSSTDNLAISSIHAYQHMLWSAYEKEKEAYAAALEGYLCTSKQDRLGRGKPVKPRAPFILVDEPTLEGIHRTFREGRPSLGLFYDEGGQFIGGHAMNKDNMLKTIAGLSKLWDGQDFSRVRGGKDESYLLFGKRFSCHLMVQPIVANSLLADKLLMGQGLLARFLITRPASLAGTRLYKDGNPSADERLGLYWKTMTAWLKKDMLENEQGELTPSKLPLTQEAKALWVKAYNAIEKELAPQGGLGDIKPFAARAAENILRVAGVVQVFEDPQSKVIEAKAMKGAIRLIVGHYLKETLRLTTRAEPSDEMAQAQRLLEWLRIKAGRKPFKESLIYQKGPPFARSASRANQLLNILLKHYWIVRTGELYQLKV